MAVINGTNKDDTLYGTANNDTIYGKNGNDLIFGLDGNDNLHGDAGVDTLFGGAGNDTLKGGWDASYLYGEFGNDDIYYNPLRGEISYGDSANSYIDGGDDDNPFDENPDYDALNIFNETTYQDAANKTQHSWTYIGIEANTFTDGVMFFKGVPEDWEAPSAWVGEFDGIEEIRVEGKGGLQFYGGATKGYIVTGTNQGDIFTSFQANDTFRGGGGNDSFYFGGGDRIESWTRDADVFTFSGGWNDGTAYLSGFNGAGKVGGDTLTINDFISDPSAQVFESNGQTIFSLSGGADILEVDAVGLVHGTDYFLA